MDSAKIAGLCAEQDDGYLFVLIEPSEQQEKEIEETMESGTPVVAKLFKQKVEACTGGRVNIELKIDSTLDPEVLEKHLRKLRDFGLI